MTSLDASPVARSIATHASPPGRGAGRWTSSLLTIRPLQMPLTGKLASTQWTTSAGSGAFSAVGAAAFSRASSASGICADASITTECPLDIGSMVQRETGDREQQQADQTDGRTHPVPHVELFQPKAAFRLFLVAGREEVGCVHWRILVGNDDERHYRERFSVIIIIPAPDREKRHGPDRDHAALSLCPLSINVPIYGATGTQ